MNGNMGNMGTGNVGKTQSRNSGRVAKPKATTAATKKSNSSAKVSNTTGGRGTSVVTKPKVKATGVTASLKRTKSSASGVPVNKGTGKAC
jgi:hypothetical protein